MNKFVDIIGDSLDNIKIIEDFMEPEDLNKIDTFLRTINKDKITNRFIHVSNDYEVPEDINELMVKYTEIVNSISSGNYNHKLDGSDKLTMRISTPGSYYPPHVDSPLVDKMPLDGPYDPNWKDSWRGELAIIIYINEDYDGGELYFPERDLVIKPKANTLIMFPGNKNFLHGVKTVENTERFTLVKWSLFLE